MESWQRKRRTGVVARSSLAALLVVASWAAVSCSGSPVESSETVSQAAAAQLQRLAGFRRTAAAPEPEQDTRQTRSNAARKKPAVEDEGLQLPIDWAELLRIFGEPGQGEESSSRQQLSPDKMAKLDSYADRLLQDERVQSYMQERIKRDGYGYGGHSGSGGSNSGSFISGLAGQVVGSVVGLSSSASRGSSSGGHHHPAPVYGPPSYQHGKGSFSFWDLKRAILNTLIQAAKALGGGVLALKGQLIKGSGYVVSTKGRVISSAGDALTGLGKKIASQAVVAPPAHYTPAHSYAYEAPVSHTYGQFSHDTSYVGAPPSSYQTTYNAASNDDDLQPGLLIAKPTPSVEIHSEHIESEPLHTDHHVQSEQGQAHEHHHVEHSHTEDLDPRNPVGPHHASGNGDAPDSHTVEESPNIPGNTLQLQDYNQNTYELYPPLGHGPPDGDYVKTEQQPPKYDSQPIDFHSSPASSSQSLQYPAAVGYQQGPPAVKYGPVPAVKYGSALPSFSYLPSHKYLPSAASHASSSPDIQIEISDHDITGFETGGYSQYKRQPASGVHIVAMHSGPLKIPILSPDSPGTYFNGFGHNSLDSYSSGSAKRLRYRPRLEIKNTIGYEVHRERRDHSNAVRRI